MQNASALYKIMANMIRHNILGQTKTVHQVLKNICQIWFAMLYEKNQTYFNNNFVVLFYEYVE